MQASRRDNARRRWPRSALSAHCRVSVWARPAAHPGFGALLDAFADEIIQSSPETATGLGLDKGARARLKSRLTDRSLSSVAADRAACQSRLRRLAGDRPRFALGPDAIRYDAVQYAFQLGADGGGFWLRENAAFGAKLETRTAPRRSGWRRGPRAKRGHRREPAQTRLARRAIGRDGR